MGACASKPKDFDKNEGVIPEAPVTPKKPDVETTPQEKQDGEETKKEEPLVDLSEPVPEAPKAVEVVAETAPAAAAEPTAKAAVEETPVPATAVIVEDKAPEVVEEKKEAEVEAVIEVAEVKTAEALKPPAA